LHAGLPEWSNGAALGAVGLVPTKVRILYPAFKDFENLRFDLSPI
jgi:hypothetical protein